MRRIFFGTGILVLGLGMLMWAMAPVIAAHGGGGGRACPLLAAAMLLQA